MSQPPLPPDMPLQPNDQTVMVPPPITPSPQYQTSSSGRNGCLWGLGGAFGCMVLIVGLMAGLVITGGQAAGGLIGSVADFIGDGFRVVGDIIAPPAVVIPEIVLPDIEPITELSELTVTSFNYANIVVSETGMPSLLQSLYGESLVLVAVGYVEAGVNLQNLTNESLVYDEDTMTLTLQLPPASLQSCFLNENESYVASRSSGLFARSAPQLDAAARRFAIEYFREQAVEQGILTTAQDRAEEVTASFMRLFTPEAITVRVISMPQPAEPILSETCR